MRAAAILGPGVSAKILRAFQQQSTTEWSLGKPAPDQSADVIAVFGGDGTLHHQLKYLADSRLPLLVVPCGSGNDFARALGLRSIEDSLNAWRKFEAGTRKLRPVDLGKITALNPRLKVEYPCEALYCCVAGAGLDSEITRRANLLPSWLRAHGGYALSLPSALLGFAAASVKLSLQPNHQPEFVEHSQKLTFIAAVANAPAYGGGMKIAPQARLDDGCLDVCLIRKLNKLRFLRLFPTVYSGRHLGLAEVEYLQTGRLRIEAERPLQVYADGEYICETPVEISVLPRALTVIGC